MLTIIPLQKTSSCSRRGFALCADRELTMLTITKQETLVIETDETRGRAQALLTDLLREKQFAETNLTAESRRDPMSVVTGRSSLDNAIERTRRMIALLEHATAALRTGLTESLTTEEQTLLSEIDNELGPTS